MFKPTMLRGAIVLTFVAMIAGTGGAVLGYQAGFEAGIAAPAQFAAKFDWPGTINKLRRSLRAAASPESARDALVQQVREQVWQLGATSASSVGQCSSGDRQALAQAATLLQGDALVADPQMQAGLAFCENLLAARSPDN